MAEYDGYFRNGMMVQLRRLKFEEEIEEAHMRNRAWICNWIFEQAQASDNPAIVKVDKDGKTYFDIKDYKTIRSYVGKLLNEVQRITSQGDYEAAKALADGYGKKVDLDMHKEVVYRSEKLNIPPYNGFMNPVLVPVTDQYGNITDIKVTYMNEFSKQMLMYSEQFGFLK
jgi:dipeptidyl-peptidase-3